MIDLLLILLGIALLDCMSMVPFAVLPMTLALGSARPLASAGAFVAGIFTVYFACGIPLLIGAEVFFEMFGAYLSRLWNQPNALELGVQILIGLLLILSAIYLRRPKKSQPESVHSPASSPKAMFLLGATLVLIGIPGAVPYLAGIERIVSSDSSWMGAISYLIYYNFIFVLPFLCLIAFRYAMPRRAGDFFATLAAFCLSVMPKLTALLFLVVGLVAVADGIGWFLGFPLLPVSPCSAHLCNSGTLDLLEQLNWKDSKTRAGTKIASQKGKDWVPEHDFALSVHINPSAPFVDLDLKAARLYLKGEVPEVLNPDGNAWKTARYEGVNLGWLKQIGNRYNNYFPKNRRIRMNLPN